MLETMPGLSVLLCLSSCAVPTAPATPFLASDYVWSQQLGSASIAGQAFVRTFWEKGETCAGRPVKLLPSGAYIDQYIALFFGGSAAGFVSEHDAQIKRGKVAPLDAGLAVLDRHTVCDTSGHFSFTSLPAGTYYVVTTVKWYVPAIVGPGQNGWEPETATLMQRVGVSDGETRTVIVTPQAAH